ncbi:uncharacterized protein LOC108916092 [Anoplophora glabripennis]|uniref:uncharacterized protein LOC108916092 n=1 Tax=Anoplophora glabripennis TaxID=217634 RepID=UPI000874915D|nr:uncharacterized protein LOC108916092 [Anoplophora glabripennis]
MKLIPLILATCFLSAVAQDSFENAGVRIVFKIFEDCTAADVFSSCLKNKAITIMDRLGRMEKFSLVDGITIIRASDVQNDETVNENQLENTLPRSADNENDDLNTRLLNKISKFIGSRNIEITMPKFSFEDFEEGGKKGGMMGGLMMAVAAKMAALIPVAIAGLFLLAGKALITAKIALLLSGIIAIKKLFAAKQGGGGGGSSHGSGWQSSGHGGGWQSGGGGWDKRSIENPQHLAYKAYSPK